MNTMSFILVTVATGIATIGSFTARWIIQKYNESPTEQANKRDTTPPLPRLSSTVAHRRPSIKLEKTLRRYKGRNPFTLKPLSTYSKFKIYFFCMTGIAFLRLLLFITILLLMYGISIAANATKSGAPWIHCWLKKLIRVACAGELIIFGFYRPFASKKNVSSKARVIVANHNTVFDGLFLLSNTNGIVAAKKEVSKIPLVGTILSVLDTLWIDRHGAGGRNAAKQQIMRQIDDASLPPLIIFPQGTISSIDTMTAFKPGAFQKPCVIQPVALDWSRNKAADLSYICTNDLAHLLYVGCCQFINYCNVQILDEYTPASEHENIAEQSRERIVKALKSTNPNIDVTPHSFADVVMLQQEMKAGSKAVSSCQITMDDIYSSLRFRTSTVTYLLEAFSKLDPDGNGYIDFNEFCQLFGQSKSKKELQYLFRLFDTKDDDEQIGFDEFLVGVATCYMDEYIEDAIKVMFKACCIIVLDEDGDEKKYVLKEHVLSMYYMNVSDGDLDSKWSRKVMIFCDDVFKVQAVEEDDNNEKLSSMTFQQFRARIKEKEEHEGVVQHFLQNMFAARFGVKLKKEDFIV